jgi:dipeptidyl aminopeptidase/acylaminoacyl peptidase
MGPAASTDVAGTLTDETLAAVDAAARAGWIDPGRVGIIGHSFGAFSTVAVLSRRPDRFRAGIAMSGPYDFSAGWGARLPQDLLVDTDGHGFTMETVGFVENGQIGLGAPPWAAHAAYERASPFFAASRITTPLLLTAGDLDLGSTSLQQSERLYAALLRSGNPAVLVRYWGEGHVQADPGAVRDQWARFGAWFDHYLKGPCQAPSSAMRPGSSDQAALARPVATTSGTRVCQ